VHDLQLSMSRQTALLDQIHQYLVTHPPAGDPLPPAPAESPNVSPG
jgi:hypothetical protein